MKVYTGSGDAGYTNFGQVHKIPKNDLHIEFCGTIDELNSFIGLLICELGSHNDLDTSFLEGRLDKKSKDNIKTKEKILKERKQVLFNLMASSDEQIINKLDETAKMFEDEIS